MATVISTRKLPSGALLTVERRTRRTVLETTVDGRQLLTAEQEDATYVDGELIGAPTPAGILVLRHEELAVNPDIPEAEAKLASAIDAKQQAAAVTDQAAELTADSVDLSR